MEPLAVYGTSRVLSVLAQNSIFNVLNCEKVVRRELSLGAATQLIGASAPLGLSIEAFGVPGKVALYLEDASKGENFGTEEGDTIGLKITDPQTGKAFFYIPGCADVDGALASRLKGAALVLSLIHI